MILAAFAATGKSYFCAKHPDRALDYECMDYKYCNYHEISNMQENKEPLKAAYALELRQGWEVEYFKAVKEMEKANPNLYIFIPPVTRVLYLLKAAGIRYTIVYPKEELLPEYIERCRNRGNSEDFIDVLTNCWDSWLDAAKSDKWADKIELSAGQYLTDLINCTGDSDYSTEIARYQEKYLSENINL